MQVKDIKLHDGITQIKVVAINSDIYVHSGKVDTPLVKHTGDFDVNEMGNEATIKEVLKENKTKNFFGRNKIKIDGSTIIQNGGNITISNSGVTIISGDGNSYVSTSTIISGQKNSVEIIVPSQFDTNTMIPTKLSLNLNTTSGKIRVADMILQNLIAESSNGGIILDDIDAVVAKLATLNGHITADIIESIMNYRTNLTTLNGKGSQDTIETEAPILLPEKHQLDADSLNGHVKVIFKGKKSL